MAVATVNMESKLNLEILEIASSGKVEQTNNIVLKIKNKQKFIEQLKLHIVPAPKADGNTVSLTICFIDDPKQKNEELKNFCDFILTNFFYCAAKTSGNSSKTEITFTLTTYSIPHIRLILSDIVKQIPELTRHFSSDLIKVIKSKGWNKGLDEIENFYNAEINLISNEDLELERDKLQSILAKSEEEEKTTIEQSISRLLDTQLAAQRKKKDELSNNIKRLTEHALATDARNKFSDLRTTYMLALALFKSGLYEQALSLFLQIPCVKDPITFYEGISLYKDAQYKIATILDKFMTPDKVMVMDAKSGREIVSTAMDALPSGAAAAASTATAADTIVDLSGAGVLDGKMQLNKPLTGAAPEPCATAANTPPVSAHVIQNADHRLGELSGKKRTQLSRYKNALPYYIRCAYLFAHKASEEMVLKIIGMCIQVDPKIIKEINATRDTAIAYANSLIGEKTGKEKFEAEIRTAELIQKAKQAAKDSIASAKASFPMECYRRLVEDNLKSGHPAEYIDKLRKACDELFNENNLNPMYQKNVRKNPGLARKRLQMKHNRSASLPAAMPQISKPIDTRPSRPPRLSEAELKLKMAAAASVASAVVAPDMPAPQSLTTLMGTNMPMNMMGDFCASAAAASSNSGTPVASISVGEHRALLATLPPTRTRASSYTPSSTIQSKSPSESPTATPSPVLASPVSTKNKLAQSPGQRAAIPLPPVPTLILSSKVASTSRSASVSSAASTTVSIGVAAATPSAIASTVVSPAKEAPKKVPPPLPATPPPASTSLKATTKVVGNSPVSLVQQVPVVYAVPASVVAQQKPPLPQTADVNAGNNPPAAGTIITPPGGLRFIVPRASNPTGTNTASGSATKPGVTTSSSPVSPGSPILTAASLHRTTTTAAGANTKLPPSNSTVNPNATAKKPKGE